MVLYKRTRKCPKITKEVIKMKKEMMKLLKSYILKYNSWRADLYLDEMLGVDVKYDKGRFMN